jgi:hypothetical protein
MRAGAVYSIREVGSKIQVAVFVCQAGLYKEKRPSLS